MRKMIFSILVISLLVLTAHNLSFSSEGQQAKNAGNKICPVSGEKINEAMKASYEYEGKVYDFCCASCIDEFKKDPEKYIKKVEEELQTGEKKETMPGSQMQESTHHGHNH